MCITVSKSPRTLDLNQFTIIEVKENQTLLTFEKLELKGKLLEQLTDQSTNYFDCGHN